MIKVLLSNSHDVYKNIAIEHYLFEHNHGELCLFLWSNNPCVVIGRNQNIYSEVNLDYAKANHIDLIRRYSGGGAVYQDLGNLNYTFYCKNKDLNKINELLINVFKDLGIDAYFSGRNDLLTQEKKFSGIAYCLEDDKVMYHGTCLIDVNLNNLVNVLKPHDYKLVSHSVASYQSRVINLKDISNITSNDIINSFISNIKKIDDIELENDIKDNDEINCYYQNLKDKNYLYNDCPAFKYKLDLKLNGSNYHFDIDYQDGIIRQVNVYSDDLNVKKANNYKALLLNKSIDLVSLKDYILNL